MKSFETATTRNIAQSNILSARRIFLCAVSKVIVAKNTKICLNIDLQLLISSPSHLLSRAYPNSDFNISRCFKMIHPTNATVVWKDANSNPVEALKHE